jgi:hypothetical protein
MYDLNNLYLSMMTNETFNDDQDDDAIWQIKRQRTMQRMTHELNVQWKMQGVQNVEARSTFTAMASPNHSPTTMVLNKTR